MLSSSKLLVLQQFSMNKANGVFSLGIDDNLIIIPVNRTLT